MRRFFVENPRQSRGLTSSPLGFTLVEMLVGMAITLVMMAAVVTLFANVSGSVRNRRATIEMSGQLRHVRNMLQQDLQGATCPGLTWQRPESNHGYIELIEGQYREGNASLLIDGTDDAAKFNPEIDHTTSILPSSNLPFGDSSWATDGGGLGDYDDILMLTVRNEHEPFVGRMPQEVRSSSNGAVNDFGFWKHETVESPLAEVVWYAVENPAAAENGDNYFGEPGMRTIYRRTLLIAPWINPYRYLATGTGAITDTFTHEGDTFKAVPGLVRVLPNDISLEQAIAAIISFQDRYDLSVRLEWDHNIGDSGRWKIVANTLGDLTKRENRFGHFGFFQGPSNSTSRIYPHAFVSVGNGYDGGNVGTVVDPEVPVPGSATPAQIRANLDTSDSVLNYTVIEAGTGYRSRPFVFVAQKSAVPATANATLNDEGQIVLVTHGPVPLWGERRGEDVMMSDVLAFDLRVYDPGAPLYRHVVTETILEPSDPGWEVAFGQDVPTVNDVIDGTSQFNYVGQGAYVNLGYGFGLTQPNSFFGTSLSGSIPWFFTPRALSDVYMESRPANERVFSQLAPGYAVYDTWSFHYENNGVNEDQLRLDGNTWQMVDSSIDEGTNGLDDPGNYGDAYNTIRLGVDDVGERETVPPYDKPLRGVQVIMRTYERDSRAIRQVRVNQHFMPE